MVTVAYRNSAKAVLISDFSSPDFSACFFPIFIVHLTNLNPPPLLSFVYQDLNVLYRWAEGNMMEFGEESFLQINHGTLNNKMVTPTRIQQERRLRVLKLTNEKSETLY